jgi:hypothetical protein
VALLGDWDDTTASELFSDNVAPDDSLARRRAAADRLVATCGGSLRILRITPASATSGDVHLVHPSGTPIRVTVQLGPLQPPRIQLYTIER